MIPVKNGALGVSENENNDFLITSVSELPKLEKQDDTRFEYNQGNSNDCTIYASVGAVSDLMNYEFSAQEIKEMNEMSYQRGRKRGEGWRTNMAIKIVCEYRNNKFPDNPVRYDSFTYNEDMIKEALDKGYTLVTTFRHNYKYWLDIYYDAILDETDFRPFSGGHATTLLKGNIIKDSYKGRKGKDGIPTNHYVLKNGIKTLVDTGAYYTNMFIVSKIKTIDRLEELKRLNDMKIEVEKAMEAHSALWFMTNSQEYKDYLHSVNNAHRKKLEDIQREFNKFQ